MAPSSRTTFFFGLGLSLGLVIAFNLTAYSSLKSTVPKTVYHASHEFVSDVGKARSNKIGNYISFPKQKGSDLRSPDRVPHSIHAHEKLDQFGGPYKEFHFMDAHRNHDDYTVAGGLYRKVRVLCWVMTSPKNLLKRAIHVRATWSKRCNKVLFMSSVANGSFPTVGTNTSEGREHLTVKTMRAFDYVAENHMDDADWFMKADDDTYVILENLRYFLSDVDPNEPVFYGHHLRTKKKENFFHGGGGYVLSKEALKRFRKRDQNVCRYKDGSAEDVEIAKCLKKLGVKMGNSLDASGRSRFHGLQLETHLSGSYANWYLEYDVNGAKWGLQSISDYAISFHYVSPQQMYNMEFFLYHLCLYGMDSHWRSQNLPTDTTPWPSV